MVCDIFRGPSPQHFLNHPTAQDYLRLPTGMKTLRSHPGRVETISRILSVDGWPRTSRVSDRVVWMGLLAGARTRPLVFWAARERIRILKLRNPPTSSSTRVPDPRPAGSIDAACSLPQESPDICCPCAEASRALARYNTFPSHAGPRANKSRRLPSRRNQTQHHICSRSPLDDALAEGNKACPTLRLTFQDRPRERL